MVAAPRRPTRDKTEGQLAWDSPSLNGARLPGAVQSSSRNTTIAPQPTERFLRTFLECITLRAAPRSYRHFPVCCPVADHSGLFEGHGSVWNLSCTDWETFFFQAEDGIRDA